MDYSLFLLKPKLCALVIFCHSPELIENRSVFRHGFLSEVMIDMFTLRTGAVPTHVV